MPFYFRPKNYPELAPIPASHRRRIIKHVCDNPMRRGKLLAVVSVPLIFFVLAIFFAFEFIGPIQFLGWATSMIVLFVSVVLLLLTILIVDMLDRRKTFTRWLATCTDHGWPHSCISCGTARSGPDSSTCEECHAPHYQLGYDGPGRPLLRAKNASDLENRSLKAIALPDQRTRQMISAFVLNRTDDPGFLRGCLGEAAGEILVVLALISWFALAGLVGLFVAVVVGVILGVAVITGVFWYAVTEPARMKRKVRKHCPDGVVPWCVHCDYDLRGSSGTLCPECGEPILVFEPKFQWRRHRRVPPPANDGES